MTITIAQVKVFPVEGELEVNHRLLQQVLAEIAPHRPDVVVTPEAFLDGYISRKAGEDRITEYAINPEQSPYASGASEWARANGCWFIFGCTRKVGDGCANTVLIYDRRGMLVGHYDKVHCQSHDKKYTPGRELPVFASDFGPFGVMICADRRWPETVRTMALKGARIIFNPTYGMNCDLNLCMMRTRSWESEVFIAFTHPRQALITAPDGQVIQNNENEEDRFVITAVDLSAVDTIRSGSLPGHLKDRRPEVYEL